MYQGPMTWLIQISWQVCCERDFHTRFRVPDTFHSLTAIRNPLSGGGIQYPEKKENVSQIFHVKSLDKQETWYPTLQKTLWVLSQLHDFVKVCAFHRAHSAFLT